jgi:hypothetical protein
MHWMKLDIIDREHQRLIFPARRLVFPVASERIVFPTPVAVRRNQENNSGRVLTLGLYRRGS